jgi:hypothetical protein
MYDQDDADVKVESMWGSIKHSAILLAGLIAVSLGATAALAIPPAIVFYLARIALSQHSAGVLAFFTGVSMLCWGALFMARRYEVNQRSGRRHK